MTKKKVTTKKKTSKTEVNLESIHDNITVAGHVYKPPQLGMYKMHSTVELPKMETTESACFDIRCHITPGETLKVFNISNDDRSQGIPEVPVERLRIPVEPGARVLIPTGIIMDIPTGYSVRLHIRSSLALKQGITLANAEGVIDADYINEVFVLVANTSNQRVFIKHGERIAQGEIIRNENIEIAETIIKPNQKGNRTGGFGSTGKE